MIAAPSTDFLAQEALAIGARPLARFFISPFDHPTGLDGSGTFVNMTYVDPAEILAAQEVASGSWTSQPIKSPCGSFPTAALATFLYNAPGFTFTFSWRAAATLSALSAAAWVPVTSGSTLQLQQYYQFQVSIVSIGRSYALEDGGSPGSFDAYAIDSLPDSLASYACEEQIPGDPDTYLENLALAGEFSVADADVECGGTLTVEAPKAFDDLVAGTHTGLSLNNRQRDSQGNPAPYFSPNKSSFVFGSGLNAQGQPAWYGKQLRIAFGYKMPDGSFEGVTLWQGKITKWGPPYRVADYTGKLQAHTCDIYARDWISDAFRTRLAIPAADGTPQPVTGGEFICAADAVSGWSPLSPFKTAYFADGTMNELSGVVAQGGGQVSLVAPGLPMNPNFPAAYAFRCAVNGGSQTACGYLSQAVPGELHVQGVLRLNQADFTTAENLHFLQFLDNSGNPVVTLYIGLNDQNEIGYIVGRAGYGPVRSTFNILSYLGTALKFAFWCNGAMYKFWINGDEILSEGNPNAAGRYAPIKSVLFGAVTAAYNESWQLDFDALELRSQYFVNSFRAYGAPFAGIGPVYSEKVVMPDSETVTGGYLQTLTRYPQYGLVQFASQDNNFQPPGGIQFRAIVDAGGLHAVDMLTRLVTLAGAASYIDTNSFAAVKAAKPLDIINFRMGDSDTFLISDAIKNICSRCLYWFVVDHGAIRLFAYTGPPAAAPVLLLDESCVADMEPGTDIDEVYDYVSAKFGWYEKDPNLIYWAGNLYGYQGQELDYTWSSEVAVEDPAMVQANVNLLYQYLSAQERWDPVKTNLAAARLELLDQVGIYSPYESDAGVCLRVLRKDVNLDPSKIQSSRASGYYPLERVQLQLMRFLGDPNYFWGQAPWGALQWGK